MNDIIIDGTAYFSELNWKKHMAEWEHFRFASGNYPRIGKSDAVMWDVICTAFGWPKPEWTMQPVKI